MTFNSGGTVTYRTCTRIRGAPDEPAHLHRSRNHEVDPHERRDLLRDAGRDRRRHVDLHGPAGRRVITNANCVHGRVTVASNGDIIVGDDIGYVTSGTDVLGLMAKNNVWVAAWVRNNLTWRAAALAENGSGRSPGRRATVPRAGR